MTLDQIKKEAAIYFGEYATSIFPMDAAKFAKHCVDKAQQWRPIESAPKDGRWIIVYRSAASSNPVGPDYWLASGIDQWGKSPWGDKPTQWQPLPPAPEAV